MKKTLSLLMLISIPSSAIASWKLRSIMPNKEEKVFIVDEGHKYKFDEFTCYVKKIGDNSKQELIFNASLFCEVGNVAVSAAFSCFSPAKDLKKDTAAVINKVIKENDLIIRQNNKNYFFSLYCD